MTLPTKKTYVECTNCGKRIELKMGRTLCIRCRNLMDKIRIAQANNSKGYEKYEEELKRVQK